MTNGTAALMMYDCSSFFKKVWDLLKFFLHLIMIVIGMLMRKKNPNIMKSTRRPDRQGCSVLKIRYRCFGNRMDKQWIGVRVLICSKEGQ